MTEQLGTRPLTVYEGHLVKEIFDAAHDEFYARLMAASQAVEDAIQALTTTEDLQAAQEAVQVAWRAYRDLSYHFPDAAGARGILQGQAMGFKMGVSYLSEVLADPRSTPGSVLKVIASMSDESALQNLLGQLSARMFIRTEVE